MQCLITQTHKLEQQEKVLSTMNNGNSPFSRKKRKPTRECSISSLSSAIASVKAPDIIKFDIGLIFDTRCPLLHTYNDLPAMDRRIILKDINEVTQVVHKHITDTDTHIFVSLHNFVDVVNKEQTVSRIMRNIYERVTGRGTFKLTYVTISTTADYLNEEDNMTVAIMDSTKDVVEEKSQDDLNKTVLWHAKVTAAQQNEERFLSTPFILEPYNEDIHLNFINHVQEKRISQSKDRYLQQHGVEWLVETVEGMKRAYPNDVIWEGIDGLHVLSV